MIFSLKKLGNIIPALKETFLRFPLPFICALGATFLALLLVHEIELINKKFILRCFASLAYGTVAFTSLKLLVESKNWSMRKHITGVMVVSAVTIIYVWGLLVEQTVTTYVFFSLATVLSLLFAPYIQKPGSQDSVWYFNYQTGVAIFFAGFAALILGIGLSIILASIGYLFEIKIPSKVYGDVWILCWGGLFSIYILANLAKEFDYEDESCEFPRGVSFIVNYILTPLMLAYMAILYAYFLKIIVQWELPRGNLGWMITTFGSIGIVTKLLAYPIRNKGTRLLALFDKYYFYVLLVPIALLGIAIGVRIHDYGVTESRYAVVLLAAWFTSVALMMIFKKDQFHIKYIPIILAALALLSTFGPWSANNVSLNSQLYRFEALLTKHKLLNNGKAVKSISEVSYEDLKALSSIADYLARRNYRLENIKPWFEILAEENTTDTVQENKRIQGRQLIEWLGLTYVNRWQTEIDKNEFEYTLGSYSEKVLYNVSGFEYAGHRSLYLYGDSSKKNTFNIPHKNKKTITTELDHKSFTIKTQSGDKVVFNLSQLIQRLQKQDSTKFELANADKLTLTQSSANRSFKARLIVKNIEGEISDSQAIEIDSMQFVLMLKFNN